MRSPGRAAMRLIASAPESGSRNTTTEPRRGQRATVESTSSQSPGSIAGCIEDSVTATRHGPRRRCRSWAARREEVSAAWSAGPAGDARLLAPAGRLPGCVDLVDHVEELPGVGEVGRGLHLRNLLVRVPEQLVEVRDLLEVLGLEVVVPEDVEMMLRQVGALLLDVDRARRERGVAVRAHLLDDLVAGLGFDPGLLGIVDATRQVAVGADDGLGGEPPAESGHGTPSRGLQGLGVPRGIVRPARGIEVSEPLRTLSNGLRISRSAARAA